MLIILIAVEVRQLRKWPNLGVGFVHVSNFSLILRSRQFFFSAERFEMSHRGRKSICACERDAFRQNYVCFVPFEKLFFGL